MATEQQIDPKEAARIDAAKIAATLAELDKPEPPPAPRPVRTVKPKPAPVAVPVNAGARVEECDEFDDEDFDTPSNAGARIPEGQTAKAAPVHVPIVPAKPGEYTLLPSGFPDISSDPELLAARANVERIQQQLSEAEAKLAESCEALGVKHWKHAPGKVEDTIERLMAEGADLAAAEEFDARGRLVRRLTGALKIAQSAVNPCHERALRRLLPAALESLIPTLVEMHRARVALTRAARAHQRAANLLEAAGFGRGHAPAVVVRTAPQYRDEIAKEFKPLVDRGLLDASEVADLLD